jgi:phosphoribosyl-ATP pyrophosphohydrolase
MGYMQIRLKNDAEFSRSVDKIANEIGEEAKEAILSGQANDRKSK